MAHFAQIENGIVSRVIVVSNDITLDEDGNESETKGIEFCQSLYGADTEWLQTSYNGNFRGRYASAGMIYDADLDEFLVPAAELTV